jgi:uncharacterized membrane protein AbrB (regulator of aidB expression)
MAELVVSSFDCRLLRMRTETGKTAILCSVAGGVAAQSQLILQRNAGRRLVRSFVRESG